ncbi:MAG TPA: hypothetical protein VGH97_07800 [Thermoanaerobaculia bacterium]|jgi:hypothetical protein
MGRNRIVPALAACAAGFALTAAAQAVDKEQRIRKSDMPEAVQATADRESAGATVKEYAKAVEKGQAVYAMDVVADGHAKEILIGGDGNVVAVREEVAVSQLPPEIQAGLKQQAGSGRIGKVIAISKNSAVTGYEASVSGAGKGKPSRIVLGVDGKPPAPPAPPEPQVP